MHKGLASAAMQVQRAGQGPDKTLAHVAPEEAQFLNYVQGGANINPQTGLPQYGLFGKILKGLARAAGAVVGFTLSGGNPLGAAAGAGLMTKATGGSWKSALTNAALGGVGGAGWNSFTGAPLMGGAAGAAGAAGGAGITASSLAAPAALSTPMVGAAGLGGVVAPAAVAPAATGILGTGITGTQALIGGSLAMSGLGALSKGSGSGDAGKLPEGFPKPTDDVTAEDIKERLKNAGFDPNRVTIAPTGNPYRYGFGPEQKMFRGSGYADGGRVRRYADGGQVQGLGAQLNPLQQAALQGYMAMRRGGPVNPSGNGGGKDDRVPAIMADNEHVIDAQTVSMAGDGNSNAGHRVLEEIKRQIREGAGQKNPKRPTPKQKGLGAIVDRAKQKAA